MKGINHTLWWGWKEHNFSAIAEIAKTGANTIRCVFGSNMGYTTPAEIKLVIEECLKNKLVPVIECHDATQTPTVAALNLCYDFWLRPDVIATIKQYEKQIILNPANEWGPYDGALWSSSNNIGIKRLRDAGINCMIMIDAGGAVGQNPRTIRDFGLTILNADANKNVAFSVHLYTYWRTSEGTDIGKWNDSGTNSPWRILDEMKGIQAKGLAVVVGEIAYGDMDSTGKRIGSPQCPYITKNALLDLKGLGIGHLAWSWNQNSDSTVDLMLVNSDYIYTGASSLSDGGKLFILDPTVGIKALAKPATIW